MRRTREMALAAVVFTAAAVLVTWPLAAHFGTESVQHGDVYFNMWRMEWFAHALRTAPTHLFDANIFYPEPRTLAYSDAMLLEGTLAAPLYWAGVPPVPVHNVMLLGGMVLSALGMYLLAAHLTGSADAGLIAGVIFACAPFRIEHIAHMELQWAVWSPLAFLALHRLLDRGRWQDGFAVGGCVALQMLSSIYYAMFLAVLLSCAAVVLLAIDRRVSVGRAAGALAAGAALALLIAAAYSRPYTRTHAKVGDRPIEEVYTYSARAGDYTAVPVENRLYGGRLRRGVAERRLFPGLAVIGLAGLGVLAGAPRRRIIVYVVLGIVAFDLSLGVNGATFRFLFERVSIFRSLRASARADLFVLLFAALLAANGFVVLVRGYAPVAKRTAVAVVVALLIAEYSTALKLVAFPNTAPAVYRVLKHQPEGVVAEFPVPRLDLLPGEDAKYAYMSTFHWYPLVNGYSGNYPPSYLARIDRLRGFPDERSVAQLSADGVRYVVVHAAAYSRDDLARLQERLLSLHHVVELGVFPADDGPSFLYLFRGT